MALIYDPHSDFLELKEIQRSLPNANQPRDPSRRPAQEYLCKIPVGLLPLLPDTPVGPTPSPATASPHSLPLPPSAPDPILLPNRYQAPVLPSQTQTQPRTYLTHLSAAAPAPRRPKPSFVFLPLLDTSTTAPEPTSVPYPSPADSQNDELHDPPTPSLSLGSPSSRASSVSPDLQSHYRIPPRSFPSSVDETKPPASSYFTSVPGASVNYTDGVLLSLTSWQDSLKFEPSDRLRHTTTVTEASAMEPIQALHGSTQIGIPQNPSSWRQSNFAGNDKGGLTLSKGFTPAYSSLPSPEPLQSVPASNVSRTSSLSSPKPQSEARRAPAFDRNQPSPPTPPLKSSSDMRRSSVRICARDVRPPSPILGPYCVPRRHRASPCPSPVMVSSPWCG